MTKALSAPLFFIAKILILSREIQIPARQRSLRELEEVSAIAKKLITLVTCFAETKNKKNKTRIILLLSNQLLPSQEKIQKVPIRFYLDDYYSSSRIS